jgi:prepilin-type N-terminal cleavage/methylation domain-containing protein
VHTNRTTRRAFTILELSIVVVITGILAVTVIPALESMTGARQAAAAEEIERRLVDARARAVAEGRPVGIRIDPAADTAQSWVIASPGDAPAPARAVNGELEPVLIIPSSYPNTSIVSFTAGDGTTSAQVLWFGFDGSPQLRNSAGTLLGPWTADAEIQLSGGLRVIVRRTSGTVDR